MEFTKRAGKYVKGTGTCTPLTLRKFMDNRGCPVVEVKGLYAEPLSSKGLGRKAFMLALRDGFTPEKTVAVERVSKPVEAKTETETAAAAPAKRKYTRKVKVQTTGKAKRKYTRRATASTSTGLSPQTQALEDIKAALAAPTPALPPAATVPVVDIPAPAPAAPVTPPAPAPAPAAPVAQESAKAETATPVAS
jgi:hypothetical protein